MLGFLFGSKDKQLVKAAEAGDLGTVRTLLGKGASAKAIHGGMSALVMAAGAGHAEIVRALLDAGADPNQHGSDETDALSATLMSGAEALTALLLERGANARAVSDEGHSALHLAAGQGTRGQVELLVARGAQVDACTADGRTPLFEACHWGKFETAQFLLQRGADANARGRDQATPLAALVSAMRMWAMRDAMPNEMRGLSGLAAVAHGIRAASEGASSVPAGMLEVMEQLVARDGDQCARDARGRSVLERAREEGAPSQVLDKLVALGAR